MPDLERPLADRGILAAEKIAARLQEKDIRPAVILTSPAVRAVQTAKIVASGIGYRLKSIRLRKALYEDDPAAFLQVIAALNANYGSVMLVGHNPSLSDFAGQLCQGFDKALTTSSVVGFEFDCTSWKNLVPGEGKLVLFEAVGKQRAEKPAKISPKTLRKNLQKEIEQKISEVLEGHDRVAMKKVRKPIKKSSRKIAGEFLDKLGEKRSK